MGSGRGWLVTGRRWGGVLDITAAAWTVGFLWWRSAKVMRMQNVSEYMLVLAVCLVVFVDEERLTPVGDFWVSASSCPHRSDTVGLVACKTFPIILKDCLWHS